MATKKICYASVSSHFEAVHCWPDAPNAQSFLRNPHRHMFEVEVNIQVFHNDREIEYLAFKDCLTVLLLTMPKPRTFSCEQYSDQIAEILNTQYKKRHVLISVREDGKEGSITSYDLD